VTKRIIAMADTEDISQAKMVLLAIYRVSKLMGNRIPFEELVLQAWRDFPDQFSLRNHPEYPDSYRIYNRIYTTLITERLIVSLRKQVYRLSDKGKELARELDIRYQNNGAEEAVLSTRFTRDEEEFLQSAVRSRAFSSWKKNKGKDLIDYDARVFFQFSTGTPVRERKRKVENARDAIEKAMVLGINDATPLHEMFKYLTNKFPELFEEG
jgi:hypothetical protein